ncbi:MAG: hypothetical protein HY329_05365 [Chloroflexi bacterium]|nr:hypothetical protein [Chloroflexota bacterium]
MTTASGGNGSSRSALGGGAAGWAPGGGTTAPSPATATARAWGRRVVGAVEVPPGRHGTAAAELALEELAGALAPADGR